MCTPSLASSFDKDVDRCFEPDRDRASRITDRAQKRDKATKEQLSKNFKDKMYNILLCTRGYHKSRSIVSIEEKEEGRTPPTQKQLVESKSMFDTGSTRFFTN